MTNEVHAQLCALGLSSPDSLVPLFPHVRDRKDIAVLRCERSGAFLLERSDHIQSVHYESKQGFVYWGSQSRRDAVRTCLEDNERRRTELSPLITNRTWLDVGTGSGAVLDALAPYANRVLAVEPQIAAREALASEGYEIYPRIADVPYSDLEVVTLFHVFEHFTQPLVELRAIRAKMKLGGTVVIEVPHARDFLLSTLDLDAFREFTFWSEHLILHTRVTLEAFIRAAGFTNIAIQGCQRYPLANHLYWLRHGKPKGHVIWNHLRDPRLDFAYAELLAKLDQSDSLIAFATA